MPSKKLKMHLIFRWDLTAVSIVIAASHASLGTYLTYQTDPLMMEWQKTSFVKILHKTLHEDHWKWCKERLGEHRVFTESSLGNLEVCLGFRIIDPENHLFKDVPLLSI